MVTRTENATELKQIVLGSLLDVEGAFDRTSFEVIEKTAEQHNSEPSIHRWISSTMASRIIIATLSRETLTWSMVRGCPVTSAVEPGDG